MAEKPWNSEEKLSVWRCPLTTAQFPVFLNDSMLGYRNNLHNINGENEKEFSYDWMAGKTLQMQEAI